MESCADASSLEKLHGNINAACQLLEDIGFESIVLISSGTGYIQLGSKKGRRFLEENCIVITDFIQYCQDGTKELELVQHKGITSVPLSILNQQGNLDRSGFEINLFQNLVTASLSNEQVTIDPELDKNDTEQVRIDTEQVRIDTEQVNTDTEQVKTDTVTIETDQDLEQSQTSVTVEHNTDILIGEDVLKEQIKSVEEVLHENSLKVDIPGGHISISHEPNLRERSAVPPPLLSALISIPLFQSQQQPCKKVSIQCSTNIGDNEYLCSSAGDQICKSKSQPTESDAKSDVSDPPQVDNISFRTNAASNQEDNDADLLESSYVNLRDEASSQTEANGNADEHMIPVSAQGSEFIVKEEPLQEDDVEGQAVSGIVYHKTGNVEELKTEFLANKEEKAGTQSTRRSSHRSKPPLVSTEAFQCDICSKTFRTRMQLNFHTMSHAGKTSYACDECGKEFIQASRLRKHQLTHSDERLHECDICGKRFKVESSLKAHRRLHSDEKPYVCETCGKRFTMARYLEEHQRIHTGEKPYSCALCGKCFRTSSCLASHRRSHGHGPSGESESVVNSEEGKMSGNSSVQKKSFCCYVCNKVFKKSSKLRDHSRIHTGEKPYSCSVCGKSFRDASLLWGHRLIHADKSFTCETCGSGFKSMKDLTRHQQLHKADKPYICDICGLQFALARYLSKHKKKHAEEQKYHCEICNKLFNSSARLTIHKRIHTGERPYKCQLCSKGFRDASTFLQHRQTHTSIRAFACDICSQRFITKKRLKYHKTLHTTKKDYYCNTCGKSFSMPRYLLLHQRIHNETNNYSCKTCGKAFRSSRSLNLHQQLHTGEKPYACDLCDKKFSIEGYLTKHRRRHTMERPYACGICTSKFFVPSQLKRHMTKHTRETHIINVGGQTNSIVAYSAKQSPAGSKKKTYTCSVCVKQFHRLWNLKQHAKRMHPCVENVFAIVS